MTRAKAKLHPVLITASLEDGRVQFTAVSDIWHTQDQALRFHKDQHGLKKQDFHLVEFTIDDKSGKGLRFPAAPHDAIWVTRIEGAGKTACPDKTTGSNYDVLEPVCVTDDGKRLFVRNGNPQREQWAFTLNFVKAGDDQADADTFTSWDPIIDNHDGGA